MLWISLTLYGHTSCQHWQSREGKFTMIKHLGGDMNKRRFCTGISIHSLWPSSQSVFSTHQLFLWSRLQQLSSFTYAILLMVTTYWPTIDVRLSQVERWSIMLPTPPLSSLFFTRPAWLLTLLFTTGKLRPSLVLSFSYFPFSMRQSPMKMSTTWLNLKKLWKVIKLMNLMRAVSPSGKTSTLILWLLDTQGEERHLK